MICRRADREPTRSALERYWTACRDRTPVGLIRRPRLVYCCPKLFDCKPDRGSSRACNFTLAALHRCFTIPSHDPSNDIQDRTHTPSVALGCPGPKATHPPISAFWGVEAACTPGGYAQTCSGDQAIRVIERERESCRCVASTWKMLIRAGDTMFVNRALTEQVRLTTNRRKRTCTSMRQQK